LSGPDHAAAVIRLSAPPAQGPAIVVLLCDAEHRLLLSVTVDGAPPTSVRRIVDLVLAVAQSGGVAGIVIGIVRERWGSTCPSRMSPLCRASSPAAPTPTSTCSTRCSWGPVAGDRSATLPPRRRRVNMAISEQ
jgi:hypothetical protein